MNGRLVKISAEVQANFDAWRERNFHDARAGRIGDVSYTRAGALDDVCAGRRAEDRRVWYATAYERGLLDHTEGLRAEEFGFLVANPLVACQLALGITDLRGLRCYRRGISHEVARLQRRAYRSKYYAKDNERRRRLAAERRRIRRRRTLNPCPTPEAFREAFMRRTESVEARVRFGGLVHDLECYVDNCLRFDENGEICGRNGGIRAWIANNVPELVGRYKTIMRYKALAKRLRQAAEISDPVPTDVLLAEKGRVDGQTPSETPSPSPVHAEQDFYAVNSRESFEKVMQMLKECGNTLAELFRNVEDMLAIDGEGMCETGVNGQGTDTMLERES